MSDMKPARYLQEGPGLTDEEAHDALVKMAREHIASTSRSAAMGLPAEMRMPEMDLTSAAGVRQMPEMDLAGDDPQVSAPQVRRGNVRQDAPSARVPPKLSVSLGTPTVDPRKRLSVSLDTPTIDPPVDNSGPRLADDESPTPSPGGVSSPRGALAAAALGARPKPDTSKPIGYRPTPIAPSDSAFDAAQAEDKATNDKNAFGRAVGAFTERPTNFLDYAMRLGGGGAGSPMPHNPAWDEKGDAVASLLSRRKADADLGVRQAAAEKAKEAKDPNSLTANVYRGVLAKMSPELSGQLEGATPETMEKIAPWLEKAAADAIATKRADGDPLEQAKLDETVRHNKATEGTAASAVASKSAGASRAPVGTLADISDPADRAAVQSILEGRSTVEDFGRDAKTRTRVMGMVRQVDPAYDSVKAAAYRHGVLEQSTNPNINAAKAVRHHMEELKKSIDDLPEETVDSPTANRIKQGLYEGAGSDRYTAMRAAASVVGSELSQALGEKDVAGREHVAKLVDPAQTKAQWAKSLPELERLRDEKLGVYSETLDNLRPGGKKPEPGKVHVSNGKETREIDAADLAAAKSAGYEVIR